jgi:hypothetical protein
MRRVLIWLLGAIMLPSCLNPAQKLQHAAMAVETDQATLDQVGGVFMRLHPCANDSTIIYRHDTTVDTTFQMVEVTGAGNIASLRPDSNGNELADYSMVHDTVRMIITRRIVDTLRITVVDYNHVQDLQDSLTQCRLQLAQSQGQTNTAVQEAAVADNRYHWTLWIAILAGLLLVILFFLLSKL